MQRCDTAVWTDFIVQIAVYQQACLANMCLKPINSGMSCENCQQYGGGTSMQHRYATVFHPNTEDLKQIRPYTIGKLVPNSVALPLLLFSFSICLPLCVYLPTATNTLLSCLI